MPVELRSRAPSPSSVVTSPPPSALRRRLPLVVGAVCVLTLGLSPIWRASSSFRTQPLQFLPHLRSKFGSRAQSSSSEGGGIRMEGSSGNTVPSIVVYVTVPNREAGKKLAQSIVKERLAACVNIVPGMDAIWFVVALCLLFRVVDLSKYVDDLISNKEALGVESVYQWQGEIQTDSEELLIIKTRQSLLDALTEHVKANHEYEVPEVISLPITGGSSAYLEWLKNSTRD